MPGASIDRWGCVKPGYRRFCAGLRCASGPYLEWLWPYGEYDFTTLHPITIEDCQGDAIPIGRPIAGTICYVLDQHHRLLPPGFPGELYTSGLGLAKAYLNKPEKTDEAFIPNPFWHENANGSIATQMMYKTGDKVRWTEHGTLGFLGRLDYQIKIRGYRLELGEVEHRLCALDIVSQAIVDVQMLHGQKQLVAWCVSEASASDILREFRRHVPAYMVPACLEVIESIPLTPIGKVDKKRLPPPIFIRQVRKKHFRRMTLSVFVQKYGSSCYRRTFNTTGRIISSISVAILCWWLKWLI